MGELFQHLQIHNLDDLEKTLAEREWQTLQPGVRVSYFFKEDNNGMSSGLLHYAPNSRVPRHEHLGFEHIYILHGSQQDDNGFYKPGSLLIHHKDTQHEIYSKEGCLALAVWQQPVAFV